MKVSELTSADIDALEQWWVEKSRKNFFAYRRFMRNDKLKYNWFIEDLCKELQKFYIKLINGQRPILVISTPPQHGKSWAIVDFISWLSGKRPDLRTIYGSYSERLGTRANLTMKRFMDSDKYKNIFPDSRIPEKGSRDAIRTNELIEFLDGKNTTTDGYFRNTTIGGPVTGETLDLGVIDDPFKGRAEANSPTIRDKVWDWFTDDFGTRFDDKAGMLIIMTRWHVDDLVGRLVKEKPETVVLNYSALATHDEAYRDEDEPLFPELKSKEFLLGKKSLMTDANFSSLYQGKPVVVGGDMIKDSWWGWWTRLPQLQYKFIVVDTAQKIKKKNDYTDLACWGMGVDGNIYLLDHLHAKFEAPALRREAFAFYTKHNTKRVNLNEPILRAMYIEDKSSGTGLIQELRLKGVKVVAVQRNTDKIFRCEDASPEIEAGRVKLNEQVSDVGVITKEAREFPNGEFDDAFDNVMSAIEVAFINKEASNSLQAAMEAD